MNLSSPSVSASRSGVKRFSGIRYAEPPVGPLRFAPPRMDQWNSSNTSHHPVVGIAPQSPSRLSNVMGDFSASQSEDCLGLTIWTPTGTDEGKLRPVLFWLHGGAFMTGAGALDWYDGSTLCHEGDIVVVSPNYRLGAFGFLFQPGLSPGNLGLLDAEMALRWTRENIRNFGGDPDRITVMGQSAGAWLAAVMAARMEVEAPPIHQLILQSGPIGIAPSKESNALKMAEFFLGGLADEKNPKTTAQMARDATVQSVLKAQNAAIQALGQSLTEPGRPPVPFGLVSDGIQLPLHDHYWHYLAKASARLPVMAGWTHDEMGAFNPTERASTASSANAHVAEQVFEAPTVKWAQAARSAGKAAFVYSFDWAPANSPFGACHCIELPFVFGTTRAFSSAPMLGSTPSGMLDKLSIQVRSAWLAFIKWGDPNHTDQNDRLPQWPLFDPAKETVMHIHQQSRLTHLTAAQAG